MLGTDDTRSLDDVARPLWKECENGQSAIAKDAIRRLLAPFGGKGMAGLYDRWVMKPGELPIEQVLGKAVASLPPNGFGLFDMAGNVWQWYGDVFDERYYGSPGAREPPRNEPMRSNMLLRSPGRSNPLSPSRQPAARSSSPWIAMHCSA